jgi:hypothetical protein
MRQAPNLETGGRSTTRLRETLRSANGRARLTRSGRHRVAGPLRAAKNLAYRVAVLVTEIDELKVSFRGLREQVEDHEVRAEGLVRRVEQGLDAQQRHLLERLEAQQQHVLDRLQQDREELLGVLEANQQKNLKVLEVLRDAEPATRRFLWQVRERPSYEAAFSEPEPLVTVAIPTYTNLSWLVERALPSVLAQTYERLDIVIVGDGASPEVEHAIRRIGDSRIRYTNLPYRGPYPDDPRLQRLVGGCPASNEAFRLAKGSWIAMMDDDDACTSDHVELLLQAARDNRWEFCYGRIRMHLPNDPEKILCEFPATGPGTVGLAASILHADLRFFTGELSDPLFNNLGDWARVNRMMRVGVRMGMIPNVILDYYPSEVWAEAHRMTPLDL